MNLFQTLLRPDKEELEHGDRALIAKAANILQVGEFQLLQLAYHDWHNKDLPEAIISQLFSSYMFGDEVPHWARHYARKIIDAEAQGGLNDNEPSFHTYDHDYHESVPGGVRRFWTAAVALMIVIGGAIALSDMSIVKAGSEGYSFPPYLDQQDLQGRQPVAPYGRADIIPVSTNVNSLLPDMGGAVGEVQNEESNWQGYTPPRGMLPAQP